MATVNDKDLSEIIRDLGRLEGQVEHISTTMDRDRAQATEGLNKLNEKIDIGFKALQTRLDTFGEDKAKIQGAWSLAAWIGGLLLVVFGGLIAKATGWLFS